MPEPLLTVGHGTASADELGTRLADAGVACLVDIRIGPGSRRHPHVNRSALAEWLPAYGVSYRWEQRLGGFRRERGVPVEHLMPGGRHAEHPLTDGVRMRDDGLLVYD